MYRRLLIITLFILGGVSLVCMTVLSSHFLAHAQGSSYYVATNGSDSNNGSFGSPFRTLQKCANRVTAGDTCYIRTGTYHETVTPSRSGTASAPITFQPYQHEAVVIDGADQVTGWTLYKGHIYQAHAVLNPKLFANQVFVNGSMMLDARWPNGGLDPLHPIRATAGMGSNNTRVNDATLTQPTGFWNGATIHFAGYDAYGSQTGMVNDSKPGTLTYAGATAICPYLCMSFGNRYYLSGILNALDQPTEWYYNRQTSTLYLWTPNGDAPGKYSIEAKQRDNAFDLTGRSYITIKNLGIFSSTIVTDSKSSHNLLDGLTARYISQTDSILAGQGGFDSLTSHQADTGIILKGSNNTLSNSDIGWSAGSGVVVNGQNQVVANNLIHDIDYTGTYSSPVVLAGKGHKILHNTIYRTGRDAINLGGEGGNPTNVAISYNDIFNANMLNRDSGTIYFCCDFQATGTVIDHNLIHDTQVDRYNTLAQAYGFNAAGIYLDNSTGGVLVHHNVLWNTGDAGIALNGADRSNPPSQNNLIYNNTIGDGEWKSLSTCGCDFKGTNLINNIFASESPSSLKNGSVANNLTASTDPRFVNPAQHDFRLQSGSKAINSGQVIPGITNGSVGSAPDIGAYEFGAAPWTAGSTLDKGILTSPVITGTNAGTGQITVSWDAVKNAKGYRLKYGTAREIYTTTLNVGNVTSYTVKNLKGNGPYYFTVSAYSPSQESPNATETWDFPHGSPLPATSTIAASSYDATSFVVNNKTYINWINDGHDGTWLEYKKMDFGSGVSTFAVTLGAPNTSTGKSIEVHLDSTTGPLVSTLTIQGTSDGYFDYNNFVTQRTNVSGATGVHDVYLVFKGVGTGFSGIASVASFTFSHATA